MLCVTAMWCYNDGRSALYSDAEEILEWLMAEPKEDDDGDPR